MYNRTWASLRPKKENKVLPAITMIACVAIWTIALIVNV